MISHEDVELVKADMCQFGMESRTAGVGSPLGPVLKPTGFMTNSWCIGRSLLRRCRKEDGHTHVHLTGGRAAGAAIYPDGLCKAICQGLVEQKSFDKATQIRTKPMAVSSLSTLCQASGCANKSTGVAPSSTVSAPIGDWNPGWVDTVHEADGHSIKSMETDDGGEAMLNSMLASLAYNGSI